MKQFFLVLFLAGFLTNIKAQEVKWYTIEEAIELNKKEPKDILVDIHSNTDKRWNKKNKKVYSNESFSNYINSNFYAVKINPLVDDTIHIGLDTFRLEAFDSAQYHKLAYILLDSSFNHPGIAFLNQKLEFVTYSTEYLSRKTADATLKGIVNNKEPYNPITFLTQPKAPAEVQWYSIEEALELIKNEPRKIMVDVYTDWCGWCKVMDKKTFQHPVIAEYLNEKYYPVKFNGEQKEDVVLGSDTLRYVAQGRRGYHQLAAALLNNKLSYPSVVFLDEEAKIIHLQQGFTKAQPFDMMLKYIGGSHYTSTPWASWSKDYESPIISSE